MCSGGDTNHVANSDKDECGICFGNNADKDECGICFGNNARMDECGVCFGYNTTCAGCDGVPNSGLVFDVCGVCGGDESSCLGCDGVPIPLGGSHFDACGYCGGSNVTCWIGCDGNAGSNVLVDCHGHCDGSGTIDACGMCSGGNVSNPLPFNFHRDSCGVCFGNDLSCTTCPSGVLDACGVCDGDNSTCAGCDGMGGVYDVCGVCAGNGTSCVIGCDGVLGSPKAYDCAGVCGGTAALDEQCDVCSSSSSPLLPTPGAFLDVCGICFGGGRDRDSCGVCLGNNTDRDVCGVCRGNNRNLDACDVCFGSDLCVDSCGVPYGNHSSCLGCDGVVNSGATRDACGTCIVPGGPGPCVPNGPSDSSLLSTTPLTVGVIGGSFTLLCLGILVALVVALKRRKSASVSAYHAKLAEEAPMGHVYIVSTDIEDSTRLWEAEPNGMEAVLEAHNEIMRDAIGETGGYEFKTEGDAFFVAFHTPLAALSFCLSVQLRLQAATWPAWLVATTSRGVPEVWNGIYVRMGIHCGEALATFDARAGRTLYYGKTLKYATAVGDSGAGGQILASQDFVKAVGRTGVDGMDGVPPFTATPGAVVMFEDMNDALLLWEILPTALYARSKRLYASRLEQRVSSFEFVKDGEDGGGAHMESLAAVAESFPEIVSFGSGFSDRTQRVSDDEGQSMVDATDVVTSASSRRRMTSISSRRRVRTRRATSRVGPLPGSPRMRAQSTRPRSRSVTALVPGASASGSRSGSARTPERRSRSGSPALARAPILRDDRDDHDVDVEVDELGSSVSLQSVSSLRSGRSPTSARSPSSVKSSRSPRSARFGSLSPRRRKGSPASVSSRRTPVSPLRRSVTAKKVTQIGSSPLSAELSRSFTALRITKPESRVRRVRRVSTSASRRGGVDGASGGGRSRSGSAADVELSSSDIGYVVAFGTGEEEEG